MTTYRGSGLQSKSTPNLPTLNSLSNPPEPSHSTTDTTHDPPLSPSSSSDEEDARPLPTSRSSTHLPYQTTTLYPPFYNRPPVPLPPSPSLTSLLRPSFTSRPTTPDSSDIDTPTPASSTLHLARLTHSARHAPTIPRASPKVPTYEYYGFAVYVGSSCAFLVFVLWAYVPAPLLHQMGIWWYPDRWWALAVPCWLVVGVVYIYVALASYNTRWLTLPLESCENLVDAAAQVAVVETATGEIRRGVDGMDSRASIHQGESKRRRGVDVNANDGLHDFEACYFPADQRVDWESLWNIGTDAVMDVPLGGVCEILYGNHP